MTNYEIKSIIGLVSFFIMSSKESNNQKDPLLDELAERILEGPVIFTPDDEFLRRVEERKTDKKVS
mgnify:CR=1 FL=1